MSKKDRAAKSPAPQGAVWVNLLYVVVSVAVVMLLWSIVSSPGMKSAKVFASPAAVLKAFTAKVQTGKIWEHLGYSVGRVLTGFSLAFVAALPVSFLMGWYEPFRRFFQPWISFLKCIPPLAFIPLVIVGAGVGESAKVIVIFIAAFLVMVITIYGGVVNVDNILIKAARVLDSNDRTIFFKVVVPASTPYIFTAVRLGLSSSLTTLIAAELTGAQVGLGQMIQEASNYFNMDVVLMGIILIGLVGITFEKIVTFFERRLTAWQEIRQK